MLAKLLQAWAMMQKYTPIIYQLVTEVIDLIQKKEAAGVKMTIPPDQLQARTSEMAEKLADYIYAADCTVCEEVKS